jgi:hypothetical protein
VSACRLNRNHDVVRRVLSLDDEERKDAGAAEPCKEPGAAP